MKRSGAQLNKEEDAAFDFDFIFIALGNTN